jgi:hypothetical protein
MELFELPYNVSFVPFGIIHGKLNQSFRQGSSVVEHWSEKPGVESSILSLATTSSKQKKPGSCESGFLIQSTARLESPSQEQDKDDENDQS